MVNKLKTKWLWFAVAAVGILVLAVFLRTYNLLSLPIFADEAIYIRWAQVMRAEPTLRFLPLSDGKQPLFMWTVMPFLKVFSDPLIAGRMVSVFSGLAATVGIFLLSLRLFKSRTGALITGLLYAVSPFSVFFDRMALVDSMLTTLGIWALYFGVLIAQTLRLDFAMFTGFALGGAWLTKSPGLFFLLMLPVTVFVSLWPKDKIQKVRYFGNLLLLWSVSGFIAFVMYNIQRLGPNFHLVASRNQDYIFTFEEVLVHPFDPFKAHLQEIAEWFWVLLPGSVLIVAFLATLFGWKKWWREITLLAAWTIFPLLVEAEFAKVFTARYILFTIPPLFILGGLFFDVIRERLHKTHWLLALVVVPAIGFDYLLLTNPEKAPLPYVERSGYLEEWTAGTGIREVAFFIRSEHDKDKNKSILVGTEGFFGTLPDGLQIYLEKVPNVVVKGVGINISSVDSSLVEGKRAGNNVYLVVNSSRFEGEPANIGLRLIQAYPKAERKPGTRGYVKHGSQDSLYLFEVLEEAIEIFEIKNAKATKSN